MASITRIIVISSILSIVYATEYRKTNLHNQLNLNSIRRTKEGRLLQYMDNETAVVYNDVMKNITRVNRVLEDLIKNYEKIKKIYRSQEVLSNEYSSNDDNAGEMVDNRSNATLSTRTTKDLVATALFYSEEKNDKNDDDDDEDVSEVTSAPVSKKTEKYKKKVLQSHESEKSKSTEDTAEETEIPTTKQHTKPTTITDKTTPKEKKMTKEKKATKEKKTKVRDISITEKPVSTTTPSLISKGTKKKEKKDAKIETKIRVEEQESASGEGSSSTMLVDSRELSAGSEEIFLDMDKSIDPGEVNHNASSLDKNDSKKEPYVKVKAVVHTEDFAPDTIWEDLKKKPVKLDKQGERLFTQYLTLRSLTVLPKLQKAVKRSQILPESLLEGVSTAKYRVSRTHSPESLEDEKVIAKEQFKTRVLRKAYGDACLKVVVKKCYKACKKAYKDGCRKYKCTGTFKNTFQTHAKGSCIKEFRENQSSNKKNDADSKNGLRQAGFGDITANGYAAAACLPPQQHHRRMANETLLKGVGVKLNILRDRFERECQKVSAGKCTIACRNASVEACREDKCADSKLDRLKKECKRYCKWSYKNKKDQDTSKKKSKKKHSSCSSSGSSSSEDDSSSSGSDLSIFDENKKKDEDDKKEKSKSKEKKYKKKKRIVRGESDPIATQDTPAQGEGINIEDQTNQTKEAKRRHKFRRHNKG